MKITDSHCHLASARFSEEERRELIEHARISGVHRMVTLSTCLEDVDANLAISEHPAVWAAIGIHPCDVHEAPDDAVMRLAALVGDTRVCAIGETGLDYFHPAPEGWDEHTFRQRQRDFLVRHFELAQAAGLNVVIHTRDKAGHDSFEDAFAIYSDYSTRVRAVFHCFLGDVRMANRVFALGGLVSFGGIATFRNAEQTREVVRDCPAGHFMVETDAPYLAPEPHRGKRNEPAYAALVAKSLAGLRGESAEAFAAHTESAAEGFFRWPSISA